LSGYIIAVFFLLGLMLGISETRGLDYMVMIKEVVEVSKKYNNLHFDSSTSIRRKLNWLEDVNKKILKNTK